MVFWVNPQVIREMAVYKVYKDSDLKIQLSLRDSESRPYRVADTVKFVIRFFTTNEHACIEASYIHGQCTNLELGEARDYAVFSRDVLQKLKDGAVYYSYEVTLIDAGGKDYLFKETVQGQTEMILKTRIKYVKQH